MHCCRYLLVFLIIPVLCLHAQTPEQETPEAIAAEQSKQLEMTIGELKNWPFSGGQKAAELLVSKGKVAIPFLLLAVKKDEPALRAGAAHCLGKLKVAEAFPVLAETARDPKMSAHLTTLFAALVQIDSQRAYPFLLEVLQTKVQTGHNAAFQAISAITKVDHLPLLQPLLQAKSTSTRKYAVELLSLIDHEECEELLIKSLSDQAPAVAHHACTLLARKDSPRITTKLLALANHVDKRARGYALMALVMLEDRSGKKLFDQEWISQMLLCVRHDDYFVRGTAAVGLVNAGFYTDKEEIVRLMDAWLVPVLLETMAGKVYFRDYVALRPLAYQKLTQLTGMDLGPDVEKWWAWWHTYSNRFHAIRLLKGLTIEDARELWWEYRLAGGIEQKHVILVASPAKAKITERKGNTQLVVLDEEQTARFLNLLQQTKFFDLQTQYGSAGPDVVQHTVEINIKNQVKKVVVYETAGGPLAPLLLEMESLLQANCWQFYWDSYQEPDWLGWYQREAEWFRTTQDPLLRNRRIKRSLLSAYGNLSVQQREPAARELLELMRQDNWLPLSAIELALFHLRSETGIPIRSELMLQALALTKETRAIHPAVEFLLRNYSPQARKLLLQLLSQVEKGLLLQYIKHPNHHLRGVAAEALGKRPADEIVVLYLIGLLKDDSIEVRQNAAGALGDLKAKTAWEALCKVSEDKQENVALRQTAILTLPRISAEEALPLLLARLGENDVDLRSSVVQAIGSVGGKTAMQTLIALLRGDPAREIRQIALNSLVQQKEPGVAEQLLQLARQNISLDSRIFALQGLAQLRVPAVMDGIAALLTDNEEDVRIHAALALAQCGDSRAIPVLLAAFTNRRYSVMVRKTLEKLTLVAFDERDEVVVQNKYQEWWRDNASLSPRQWLFAALSRKNYDVSLLLDYLLGNADPAAIPVFIQALEDRDWFVRAAACRALQELSGQNFGAIEPYTGQQTTQAIRKAWQDWYRERK